MIKTSLPVIDPEELRRIPLFGAFTPGQILDLSHMLRRRKFARDDVIFHQGDDGESFYIIESGTVRITQLSEDGRELTLIVLRKGDFFGDMSLLDGEPRSAAAITAEETEVLTLFRDDFMNFIIRYPPASLEILRVLSLRLRRMDEVLAEAIFQTATVRLARRLMELMTIYGEEIEDGILLNVSITQSRLAEMVGATRVTVNKELAHMESDGVLKRVKRKIIIVDDDQLRRLALVTA